MKDTKQNTLYLAQKYAQIFVPGHYLKDFPELRTLSENCLLLRRDDVCGQTEPNGTKWRLLFIYHELSLFPKPVKKINTS